MQKFWLESISKEAALRHSWHQRYAKQFKENQATPKAAKTRRHGSVPNGNTVAERIRRLESERRVKIGATSPDKADSSSSKKEKITNSLSLKDMRPATAGTRQLLYNGISAHGGGRYAYLRKRKMLNPEEKFEFPILSSCQYGWKMREFGGEPKSSPYARVCVIKDSFYRNSGIIFG